MEKVFISRDNTATFICPECGKTKTANVEKYKQIDKVVKVKIKCPCGYAYTVVLEKRRHYRKETNFSGVYTHIASGKEAGRGRITIVDISQSGLKLKLCVAPKMEAGDKLIVEFHLDDKAKTLIKKEGIVRSLFGMKIGLEFCAVDLSNPYDKAIGFYLMR